MLEIKSISGFISDISPDFFSQEKGQWVFRGQSSTKYQLLPSIGRSTTHTSSSIKKYERSVFNTFKREARAFLTDAPKDDWEWLALAQHHGLSTRLLDWSLNPLVALYFSVSENFTEDGKFFALNAPKKIPKHILSNSPFAVKMPFKFYPDALTPRIRAQEGLFIVFSEIDKELSSFSRNDWEIREYLIPSAAKKDLRYELYRLGIHTDSLFPDLDGIAERIMWQHTATPLKA